jgi:hypothetical protein
MWEPLNKALFDETSNSITIVHDITELVEAVEVTLNILAATAGGAGASAIATSAANTLETLEAVGPEAGALSGVLFPVAGGVAAVVGLFAILGLPYHEAAVVIADRNSALGYAEGLFLGVYGAKTEFVSSRFIKRVPTDNPYDENLVVIELNYFNAGLLRGYAEGRQLLPNQKDVLIIEAARIGNFATQETPDFDYYISAATAFLRAHFADAVGARPVDPDPRASNGDAST